MRNPERRLARLMEIGLSLVGDLDLETVLRRVLDAAQELTSARYAALGVLDPSGKGLERFLTVGIDQPAQARIGDLPHGHGVLGVLIRDPKPLRLRDVGRHPQSYGFPSGHPPMGSFLGAPIRVGGEVFGNLYLTDKTDADEFDDSDQDLLVGLAEWAAVAIGNARRHTGVRGHRDELERSVRAFETTEAIGSALAGETDLDRIVELVVKRARALVNARTVVLALCDGRDLIIRGQSGRSSHQLKGERGPAEGSLAAQAITSGRPIRRGSGPRFARPVLPWVTDAGAALVVPLRFHAASLGVLVAIDRIDEATEFSAEDERLLSAFATAAAGSVATSHDAAASGLRRSLQAAERERSRWARELHDQTLQDMAGLKILLSAARRSPDRAAVDGALDEAVDQIQLAVTALRGLITDLRPAALDELGAGPALGALVARTTTATGLEIDMHVDLAYEAGRVGARHTPEVEATIYRLVQESLTNIAKHAGASRVSIGVVESGAEIVVTVQDDGAGFDTGAAAQGFGLLGMRERVALIDGSLRVDSEPGAGTTVTAELPVRRFGTADETAAADTGVRMALTA